MLRWVACSGGGAPVEGVRAGEDHDGGEIFAGRAVHEGEVLPAKVTPAHGCAFVSFDGREHSKDDYEVCKVLEHLGCTHVSQEVEISFPW